MSQFTLEVYTTETGKSPFMDWRAALDKVSRAKIDQRLERIQLGNFGDHKHIDGLLYELRFLNVGPGYRVYYALRAKTVILLLHGGEKATQTADIQKAKAYLG